MNLSAKGLDTINLNSMIINVLRDITNFGMLIAYLNVD